VTCIGKGSFLVVLVASVTTGTMACRGHTNGPPNNSVLSGFRRLFRIMLWM
jgi:hypothetical protein